jgi:hypothetical protein
VRVPSGNEYRPSEQTVARVDVRYIDHALTPAERSQPSATRHRPAEREGMVLDDGFPHVHDLGRLASAIPSSRSRSGVPPPLRGVQRRLRRPDPFLPLRRAKSATLRPLHEKDGASMPPEYTGIMASNSETTITAYAFLAAYRCLRYHTA